MTEPRNAAGEMRWRVHTFGGSGVADAACMARVAGNPAGRFRPRVAAVLSACRGVTDALLALVSVAERRDPAVPDGRTSTS